MIPLSYEALDHAHSFSSSQVPEGFVAIHKNTLRILLLENLGSVFNQETLPLQHTPRKIATIPGSVSDPVSGKKVAIPNRLSLRCLMLGAL
jgi:hypothetical protein